MKSISELIEHYKQNKFKKHTFICYLSSVFSLSKKAIIDLVSENEINISENEIYEILRAYAILASSHKITSSLQEKLKKFSFLDRINLLAITEDYLDASLIDCTDEEILIIKKIPIENTEKSFFAIQDENNITVNESNLNLQIKPDNKLKNIDTLLSLDDLAKKLKIAAKELFSMFVTLGWVGRDGFFRWKITDKAKVEGVVDELKDVKKEKIWPISIMDHQEFKNLSIPPRDVVSVTKEDELSLSIDDITSLQFDHENTFKKYIILAFSKDVEKNIIGDIVDIYYDLYDPDNSDKTYEIYFDKYTEFYDAFEKLGEYFLSLEEIQLLNSDQIIETIEMKINLSIDVERTELLPNNEKSLLSTKELAHDISMNYNETLAILSGLGLVEFHDEIWNITSKANELGSKQEQDVILWQIQVVDYIMEECKSLLLKMFEDTKKVDEIWGTIPDPERKQFVDILNEVM